jgi:hypothetical protein
MRAIVISVGLATLVLTAGCRDTLVTRYSTVQDAKKDRLFERGWVPEVLPETAGPLTEAHNIDTNARCAMAVFPANMFDQVLSSLSKQGFQRHEADVPAPPLRVCPFSIGDFRRSSIVLRRAGANGDMELAGLGKNGTFMFMGIR